MNESVQTIVLVIQNLRNLFKDKDRLIGFDDWDNFVGCVKTLEDIAMELQVKEEQNSQENTAEE